MPYFVLIEFDDDEKAKKYVQDTLSKEEFHEGLLLDPVPIFKAVAVWRKPTMWCDNSDGHRKKKTASGWTRGRKWGWWVCAICGKPSLGWVEGSLWRFDSAFGYNLLPDSITGKRPTFTGRSPEEWTWLESSSTSEE